MISIETNSSSDDSKEDGNHNHTHSHNHNHNNNNNHNENKNKNKNNKNMSKTKNKRLKKCKLGRLYKQQVWVLDQKPSFTNKTIGNRTEISGGGVIPKTKPLRFRWGFIAIYVGPRLF